MLDILIVPKIGIRPMVTSGSFTTIPAAVAAVSPIAVINPALIFNNFLFNSAISLVVLFFIIIFASSYVSGFSSILFTSFS